jgi:hypothetical protein
MEMWPEVILDLTEPRHPKMMEMWHEVRSTDAGSTVSFVQSSLAICKHHRAHKRLQIPQVSCLSLVQPVVRLPEQMSQCVVVGYDKELIRASFKMIAPPMLESFTFGQSF